jgi:cyclophilin family peptidyl-prolyl cis-trans isomerase
MEAYQMMTLLPYAVSSLLTLTACGASASDSQVAGATTDQEETSVTAVSDAALEAIDGFIQEQKVDTSKTGWRTRLAKPPKVTFTKDKTYFWNIETNLGALKVKLLPKTAPMHVSSTIYLTRIGFYDNLSFHRVIPGFMAQGGCPQGSGRGNPGYAYAGEFDPKVKHDRPGLLSMANAGPGTDGSQFFLTFVATPHLDNKHTIFGEVVDGLPTLKELEKRGSGGSGRPTEPLAMKKCSITVE